MSTNESPDISQRVTVPEMVRRSLESLKEQWSFIDVDRIMNLYITGEITPFKDNKFYRLEEAVLNIACESILQVLREHPDIPAYVVDKKDNVIIQTLTAGEVLGKNPLND